MIDVVCLGCAAVPLGMTLRNLRELRVPPRAPGRPKMSVLVPARNEEQNIGACCAAVLANVDVELQLIVLDDGSTDRTCEIVSALHDVRVRLAKAPPLPAGWCGKQHACHVLGEMADFDLLVFIDADVRLSADALSRMAGFMQAHDAPLSSGVPRQVVVSWSEQLLIPLIHFLLLGFLPLWLMRRRLHPALGAGCGQLFVARREVYRAVGGHGAIGGRIHDGLALPRLFRKAGHRTLLFDATTLAHCRMYANVAQVWEGLCKNATEGMARPVALPLWTVMLGAGQVLPLGLVLAQPSRYSGLALAVGIVTRLILAARFRQPLRAAFLQPVAVAGLLLVQWFSLLRAACGGHSTWRGRTYSAS